MLVSAVSEATVYHYGDLRYFAPLTGRNWLYEGDTLSVSLCPTEWTKFAPPDPPAALYAITKNDGTAAVFIVLDSLEPADKLVIERWATAAGLGSLAAPDLAGLSRAHRTSVPEEFGEMAILMAWAKAQPEADGIWFSRQISADMPDTSRGGIFQHRLPLFDARLVAELSDLWPAARKPLVVTKNFP